MVRIRAGRQPGQPLGPAAQVCPEGPSHPLILGCPWEHPHRGGDWAQLGSQAAAEPGEAGWAGREGSRRLGTSLTQPCALQVLPGASGLRSTPSSGARCMRCWPHCSAWARVSGASVSGAAPRVVSPEARPHPHWPWISFAALAKPHPWLCPRTPLGTLAQILPECTLGPFPL